MLPRQVKGAPVAQWVKSSPTDLAIPDSSLAQDEIFSTVKGVPLHTAFHYHPPMEAGFTTGCCCCVVLHPR